MSARGCEVKGCENKHLAKGYCAPHYHRARRATEQKPHREEKPRRLVHSILEHDPETKTGTCAICGPVDVQIRKSSRVECMTARRAQMTNEDWRRRDLRRKYNLTPEDFDAMSLAQGGKCAICGAQPTNCALSVDHDHATGQVRGLLCKPCNLGIGHLRDDVSRLREAINYLNAHNTPAV